MAEKKVAAESPDRIPYYNRELSWMDFNARVLEEAFEKGNPVMERVRFLAITASNLDEFFMVRVAGVMDQIAEKYSAPDSSGMTPAEVYTDLSERIHTFMQRQYSCLHRSILPALERCGVSFLKPEAMDDEQLDYISEYFSKVLFPVLTPLAVDRSRPFPILANKSLNIAVRLDGSKDGEDCFAIVQVPSILSRFLKVPGKSGNCFVLLENVIMHCMERLFEEKKILAVCPFRITRDSDLDIDEESDDLMIEIEKSIKKRKRGNPVRLELLQHCDNALRKFLLDMLELKENSIYSLPGPLDLTFFSKFANLPGYERLCFLPIAPVYPPEDFWGEDDIFAAIRKKDCLVHHPYDSFDIVVDFIRAAAEDADVLAIKQTLYRVSGHSSIVTALMRAAENGKQVTVLVELKARFDEENNIIWAKKLESAGCHVIYGLVGLKTHCKIALVVRREEDGIRRYLHMGTGNYNDSTAKIYTDLGLFTCKEPFGMDASNLFNVLTGYSRPPEYNKFIVAPHGMRSFFEYRIRCETENARQGLPSGITVKVNALVDEEIIGLLYEASRAGVKIRLIVRGICCLIPGLPGASENIEVISIVGQLLEHSRIYCFENAGNPKIYLGSADWMPRNLDRRVELVFPVEDARLKDRIFHILDVMLRDNINARRMKSDKSYEHVSRRGKIPCNCQTEFSRMAHETERKLSEQDDKKPLKPLHSPITSGE